MSNVVLIPTGTCFDDAAQVFVSFVRDVRNITPYLVHGLFNLYNKPASHAWVEVDDYVYNVSLIRNIKAICVFDRNKFLEAHKCDDFTRYSRDDVISRSMESNCSGPWEQKYINGCGNLRSKPSVEIELDFLGVSPFPS
jgi:hypothetical protein